MRSFMEMTNSPVIQVSHLSKHFNLEAGFFAKNKKTVYAVNDVSFCLERGKTYGLVGESGCGKTTTARLIIQMYKQSSGEIFYYPKSLPEDTSEFLNVENFSKKELKKFREKVKYVFQDPARSLNPRMTVFEVLTSGLKYSSMWKGKEEALKLAQEIIQEVGLKKEDLYRRPAEFSGGQRQRISIARGLIMNPDLLICDEVVSALDVSIQGQIINLLIDLRKKRNLSYLFITHDLKVACYFCDKIGVMYRGVLVEEAPAENLYKEALHPYTKLLFEGAKNLLSNSSLEVKTTLEEEVSCPFAHRCPKAREKCRRQMPELQTLDDGHKVRCFNY